MTLYGLQEAMADGDDHFEDGTPEEQREGNEARPADADAEE